MARLCELAPKHLDGERDSFFIDIERPLSESLKLGTAYGIHWGTIRHEVVIVVNDVPHLYYIPVKQWLPLRKRLENRGVPRNTYAFEITTVETDDTEVPENAGDEPLEPKAGDTVTTLTESGSKTEIIGTKSYYWRPDGADTTTLNQ